MKVGLAPIANKESCILLLGTMPGDHSLQLKQYYGNSINQFWRIIFTLFNEPPTEDYNKKVELLLNNNIALWDVLANCKRKGSAESSIKEEIPNDFVSFYKKHPNIKHVIFTSNKAETYYNLYIGKNAVRNYYLLPSPSRSNSWQSVTTKINEWKLILRLIEENKYPAQRNISTG